MATNLSELRAEGMVTKIPALRRRRWRDPSIFIIYFFFFFFHFLHWPGEIEKAEGGRIKRKANLLLGTLEPLYGKDVSKNILNALSWGLLVADSFYLPTYPYAFVSAPITLA